MYKFIFTITLTIITYYFKVYLFFLGCDAIAQLLWKNYELGIEKLENIEIIKLST